jgi:hypothetical protein
MAAATIALAGAVMTRAGVCCGAIRRATYGRWLPRLPGRWLRRLCCCRSGLVGRIRTNAALLLVLVAVAAAGNRLARALAVVGAAVWFDFFFTLPYYGLTIRSSDDVTAAVLLLVTVLAVSQLAAWSRKLKVIAVTGEGHLESMPSTVALAQASCHRRRCPNTWGVLADPLDCRGGGLSTARCAATRRGWIPTAALALAAV